VSMARWLVAGALVVAALPLPLGVMSEPACAATPDHAGLVVDTGSDSSSYCVALPASSVTGTDLIQLAGEQYGLDYRLGFDGGGVCRLAGVGPADGDCFGDFPSFWGYWRGDGSGGWTWSNVGASQTTVGIGDVDGWAWGEGTDAQTHPRPRDTTFEQACPSASPTPHSSPSRGRGPTRSGDAGRRPVVGVRSEASLVPSASSSTRGAAGTEPGRSDARRASDSRSRALAGGALARGASASVLASSSLRPDAGVPVGAYASALAVAMLLGASFVARRRRRAAG